MSVWFCRFGAWFWCVCVRFQKLCGSKDCACKQAVENNCNSNGHIYTAVLISQFTSYIFGIYSFKNTDGIIEKYMNTKLGFLYQFEMFSVL